MKLKFFALSLFMVAGFNVVNAQSTTCLLYTSDAADE